jgi:hypothetical protein
MFRGLARVAVWLAALIFFPTGAAMADTLTLQNGGTVTGSFTYDATANSVVSFNFTTTAGGGFGNESYIGPVLGSSGAVVLTNQDGDQVFGFDSVQSNGNVDELDIVLSCNGVLNCAQQAAAGNSFAVTTGFPQCPNPGTTTGFCIASGLQNQVPGGLIPEDLISAGNFLTITDPTCPSTDSCFTMTLSTTSTGTVFGGGGGGGNNNGVPEPSTLLLSALGLGALALKRFYA